MGLWWTFCSHQALNYKHDQKTNSDDTWNFTVVEMRGQFSKTEVHISALKKILSRFEAKLFSVSSVAHPGIQPGHPGHLRSPQSAWHAWHPGRLGWYCGCGFEEKTRVRAFIWPHILHIFHNTYENMHAPYVSSLFSFIEVMLPCKLLPWLRLLGSPWLVVH